MSGEVYVSQNACRGHGIVGLAFEVERWVKLLADLFVEHGTLLSTALEGSGDRRQGCASEVEWSWLPDRR